MNIATPLRHPPTGGGGSAHNDRRVGCGISYS